MQFDFDRANHLQPQFTVIEQPASIPVTRKGNAVVAVDRLKSRITRLLPSFHATKEGVECFIDAAQHILAAGIIGQLQIAVSPNFFQLVGLIEVIDRFTGYAVSITTLLKRGVIESAGFSQLAVEHLDLPACRVQPIFEILPQLSPLLVLYIFSDRRFGHVPDRTDVITAAPQRREPRFQKGKFLPEKAGCETFELGRNVRRRQGRIGFDKHMDVIRHDLKRMYRCLQLRRFLVQQFFQALSDLASEDRFAIFGTPNELIFKCKNRSGILSIPSIDHRRYANMSLDTLQLTNAGL